MSYETVLVEAAGGVGTITLNRPEVRNALNQTMVREIWEALQALEAEREVRVAVLRGAGTRPSAPALISRAWATAARRSRRASPSGGS